MSDTSSNHSDEDVPQFWRRYEVTAPEVGAGVCFSSDETLTDDEYRHQLAEKLEVTPEDVSVRLTVEYIANFQKGRWDEKVIDDGVRPSGKSFSLCSYYNEVVANAGEHQPPGSARSLCADHSDYETRDFKCPNDDVQANCEWNGLLEKLETIIRADRNGSSIQTIVVDLLGGDSPDSLHMNVGEKFLKDAFSWSGEDSNKALKSRLYQATVEDAHDGWP
ncbi:hypothetical protein L202_01943 [Cryptococcus amylolentus CBS 6039]|uniref:Uncharacterized protein n=1 Tax=Cryptococcus amylolentus CBS 6039 TaxID=1295533 RepID=A0A1E3HYU7_9TREE|nr:hypothetical protein L202_01943 [Cryptococcus amylolentus CBS 6039]ODN81522.1 hypothetical protein L202_01943 [Cryptococcus amylolentus CBS 6039]